jgi:hypothetical protein
MSMVARSHHLGSRSLADQTDGRNYLYAASLASRRHSPTAISYAPARRSEGQTSLAINGHGNNLKTDRPKLSSHTECPLRNTKRVDPDGYCTTINNKTWMKVTMKVRRHILELQEGGTWLAPLSAGLWSLIDRLISFYRRSRCLLRNP